jgi:hypothetical protein
VRHFLLGETRQIDPAGLPGSVGRHLFFAVLSRSTTRASTDELRRSRKSLNQGAELLQPLLFDRRGSRRVQK